MPGLLTTLLIEINKLVGINRHEAEYLKRLLIGQLGHAVGRVLNAIWATLSDQKRGIRASRYQDGLIRSLPDHLLRDIGIEPPIRLQTRTNQFQSPLEFQTWLAYNQTFWR